MSEPAERRGFKIVHRPLEISFSEDALAPSLPGEIDGRTVAIHKVHMEHATVERCLLHLPNVLPQECRIGLVPAELDHFLAGSAGLSGRCPFRLRGHLSRKLKGKQTKTEREAEEMHNCMDRLSNHLIQFNPIRRPHPEGVNRADPVKLSG